MGWQAFATPEYPSTEAGQSPSTVVESRLHRGWRARRRGSGSRARYDLTLNNGCILVEGAERGLEERYYFSVSRGALPRRPWRAGWVYFLPSDTFVEQPPATYAGRPARVPQLASSVPVRPFARVRVEPEDFPFLDRIRSHDDERLSEYARAVMGAEPWPD